VPVISRLGSVAGQRQPGAEQAAYAVTMNRSLRGKRLMQRSLDLHGDCKPLALVIGPATSSTRSPSCPSSAS
jgi:hypothetical protein